MLTAIAWISIIIGLVIMFFGALGMIILPDLFQRFHASTKCGVSGAFSLLIGLALHASSLEYSIKFFVIVLFLIITTPLVAHLLALSKMEHSVTDAQEEE